MGGAPLSAVNTSYTCAAAMADELETLLVKFKIRKSLIEKLESEDINSMEIFRSLTKEDLKMLLDRVGISIGQYSQLCRAWESLRPRCRSPEKDIDHATKSPRRESSGNFKVILFDDNSNEYNNNNIYIYI